MIARRIKLILITCWLVPSLFIFFNVHVYKNVTLSGLTKKQLTFLMKGPPVVLEPTKPVHTLYYPAEFDPLDYNNSVNPYPFTYIINNETKCAGVETVKYLIYVLSTPYHFNERRITRATWAKDNLFPDWESRVIFLVAYTNNTKVQEQLYEEGRIYGDVVQDSYIDSYANLTYKGMQAMKWVHKYCKNAEIVMKTDEDIYVNIFLMRELWEKKLVNKTNWFLCRVNINKLVMRDGECGKWCITQEDLPRLKMYPSYCDGPMYMWDGRMATEMINASLNTPFFWLEDVYFTGFAANKIEGRKHIDIGWMFRIWDRHFKKQFYTVKPREYVVGLLPTGDEKLDVWRKNLLMLTPEEITMLGEENYQNLMANSWNLLD